MAEIERRERGHDVHAQSTPDPVEIFEVGKQAVRLLRDPNTSFSQIADRIDQAQQLRETVMAYAQVQFRDRGRIRGTRDAVTLIGLQELEKLLLAEMRRIGAASMGRRQNLNHRIAALQIAPPSITAPVSPRTKRYADQ